jgi:hypothetical protein
MIKNSSGALTSNFEAINDCVANTFGSKAAPKCETHVTAPGKQFNQWFYASNFVNGTLDPITDDDMSSTDGTTQDANGELLQMIIDHPEMNAATLLNLIKSKGMKVTMDAPMEAEQSSGYSELTRESTGPKSLGNITLNCRFREMDNSAILDPSAATKFRAVLIQEGLGNTRDGYYYTRQALESALPVFEGKKMYADHPDRISEETRPERSVRDIIGHFENVAVVTGKDGRAILEADAIMMPDTPFQWARALMRQAVMYSKKYPDKDFVGLSINASGDANPLPSDTFLSQIQVPDSARPKIQDAIDSGLTEIKVVSNISDAVSCDLVTEAGAKGRLLKMLEAEMGKKKEDKATKESEMKHSEYEAKKEDAGPPSDSAGKSGPIEGEGMGDDAEPAHADEDQDIALIKQMLAKYLGADSDMDESAMKCAKHYMQHYESAGYEPQEAMQRACEAMAAAKHAHSAMEGSTPPVTAAAPAAAPAADGAPSAKPMAPQAKKEGDEMENHANPKDTTFGAPGEVHIHMGKQESAAQQVLRLQGENAKLKEAFAKMQLVETLDKLLEKSGHPMSMTKRFRETDACKEARTSKELEKAFAIFEAGYKLNESAFDMGFADTLAGVEKEYAPSKDANVDFSDCTEN